MKTRYALSGALALAFMATPAMADPLTTLLDRIFGQPQGVPRSFPYVPAPGAEPPRGGVWSLISSHVSARIGPQWVPTALRIAKIESGGRCDARNGRAVGVFQVIHPEQFGVSRAEAKTCDGGVRAGVEHMRACLAKGARTGAQMMRCHNSGSPHGRVEKAYRPFV